MRSKQFYLAIIIGITLMCGSAFSQGKGGGKGKDKGGRGGDSHVERGNGNRGGNMDRGRGNGNFKDRRGEDRQGRGNRDFRVEQRSSQADWNNKRRQQQQYDWNARRQQQINEWNARRQRQIENDRGRRQQDVNAWNARRQRQIIDANERFERQRNKHDRKEEKRNARHREVFIDRGGFPVFGGRGKAGKFPRGNAYGLRGIWPGEFRGFRDPDKRARKEMRELRKRGYSNSHYYYYDDRDRVFNVWNDRDDYYDDRYYDDDRGFSRENIFRAILSNFFGGGVNNGHDLYATSYYPQQQYVSYAPAYYGYQPSYAYAPQYYTPDYYPSYSDAYYDEPGFGSSPFLSEIFGGSDSGWLGIVGQLLSGMLGQGYLQGLNDGEFARYNGLGNDAYYNPYAYDEAYYAPQTLSLDQQRAYLSQGYELGYRDALRSRDPFDTASFGGLDVLSAFLGNGLRFD